MTDRTDNLPAPGNTRRKLAAPVASRIGRTAVLLTHAEVDRETGEVVAYFGRTLTTPSRTVSVDPSQRTTP